LQWWLPNLFLLVYPLFFIFWLSRDSSYWRSHNGQKYSGLCQRDCSVTYGMMIDSLSVLMFLRKKFESQLGHNSKEW
jgi:hypothetical protein